MVRAPRPRPPDVAERVLDPLPGRCTRPLRVAASTLGGESVAFGAARLAWTTSGPACSPRVTFWSRRSEKGTGHPGSLIPLCLHNNTLYGVESNGGSGGNHQLAVKETDGTPAGSDYELAPLAFTADGPPVFIEVEDGGGAITVGVGHAG